MCLFLVISPGYYFQRFLNERFPISIFMDFLRFNFYVDSKYDKKETILISHSVKKILYECVFISKERY